MKTYDDYFEKFFKIENMSFWSLFRKTFFTLIEKRFQNHSYEIDLAQDLLNKYSFDGILLQNEAGPHEQILIQLSKSQKIPIYLMQHGLIFDTDEALSMNKYQGVLGQNSDYQLVWGNIDYEYRKKHGFDPDKIIKIGSPIYDNFSNYENSEKNYILLATSGPTKEKIFDLTVESITKNIETIKKISEIITSMNHDLVIKIHPSPDEFDPTELVKKINSNIRVIKSGNISSVIKNCSLIIVIDFSSVILDAYLLEKPIISIPVKNNGYGLPTALVDNSCTIRNIENLEKTINQILQSKYSEKIKNSRISARNYLSNIDSSAEKLLSFLSINKSSV